MNPPDTEWLNATRSVFGGTGDEIRLGSTITRPIIEVIDDLNSRDWDGFVCSPMSVDQADYQDTERWWL